MASVHPEPTPQAAHVEKKSIYLKAHLLNSVCKTWDYITYHLLNIMYCIEKGE